MGMLRTCKNHALLISNWYYTLETGTPGKTCVIPNVVPERDSEGNTRRDGVRDLYVLTSDAIGGQSYFRSWLFRWFYFRHWYFRATFVIPVRESRMNTVHGEVLLRGMTKDRETARLHL